MAAPAFDCQRIPRPVAPGHQFAPPLDAARRDEATAACRAILLAWHDRAFSTERLALEPLRVSDKSQTHLVRPRGERPIVFKRHRDPFTYVRELLALTLLAESQSVPRLVAGLDASRSLMIEYLCHPFVVGDGTDLAAVAGALGRVHASMRSQPATLATLFPDATAGHLVQTEQPPAPWVKDRRAYREVLRLITHTAGDDYVSLSIGDVKSEHLFQRSGRCVFVDLETFAPGRPEQLDVLSLLNVAPGQRLSAAEWLEVLDAYRRGRREAGAPFLSLDQLLDSVRLMARAIGLPEELAP